MTQLSDLYGRPLSLLTDLYQLTMASAYQASGMAEREAVFHLFFRKEPFGGSYAIAGGLSHLIDFLRDLRFDDDAIAFLATLEGNDSKPLFSEDFLEYLRGVELALDIDAVEEGRVVFAHEPLVRVRGPLLQCQIVETALLTIVNFQTLIATKASRVCRAARGEPVLEFGLRRAQGIDGALSASRAAYLGGCAATSNVLASQLYGIPVRGTHAHSWVMAFGDELEAFRAYAASQPNNCVFLVDTFDTIEGVHNAIEVALELRESGHELVGVRLDSGDLADLSIRTRRLLDAAGFKDAAIVASNDLDDTTIRELKTAGAKISVWGVGTKLVTAFDQPALGGVYKLGALRSEDGEWDHRVKLSDDLIKVSNPGVQQVRRYYDRDAALLDVIYLDGADLSAGCRTAEGVPLAGDNDCEDLLVPIFRGGSQTYECPSLVVSRELARSDLARFPDSLLDGEVFADSPERYRVSLHEDLDSLKRRLVDEHRRS